MKSHRVQTQTENSRLGRREQLAWKIAEVASSQPPVDPDTARMATMRIIDSWAVAVAALDRPSVHAAQGLALDHRRAGGASLIGMSPHIRTDAFWSAYANATAIRELDYNDSFFAADSSHPSDVIGPIAAVAEARRMTGERLIRGILTAYEIQVQLVKGIELNRYRIDHVAHLGPAIAAGIGAMLGLETEIIYHAVNLSAHLSVSTRQTRKGTISSYKANAPGHIGQIALLSVDRAMRGEMGPSPVYEGDYGLLAVLLGGSESEVWVELPGAGESHRAILETYPKEHSAGYHGQAMIDLAIRMRSRIDDLSRIRDITIHTKHLTHLVMGSGAGDPEKWDPRATRETLDHSAMYIFTVALQDGSWHHVTSYTPKRTGRKDTVSLWRQVRTVSDPFWTQEFEHPAPLDKAHGARVIITLDDGSVLEDELRVANAHPRGHSPWGYTAYRDKFLKLVDGIVPDDESTRFLDRVRGMVDRHLTDTVDLSINAGIGLERAHTIGLLSSETP